MLVKSTPGVNFINVKRANFLYKILAPKPLRNYKKGCSYEKFVRKTLMKLTPDRNEELKEGLNKFDRLAGDLFEKMNFTPVKQQEIMLSVLWFTAEPWYQFNDLSFVPKSLNVSKLKNNKTF